MKSHPEQPDFHFSVPYLCGLGDRAGTLYIRDKTYLNTYSIDDPFAAKIAAKTIELRNYPSDEVLLGEEMEKCDIKDANADALKVNIRTIMSRVVNLFPVGSANWFRFGTTALDEMNDYELAYCGGRVGLMTEKFDTELAAKGVTPLMISEQKALALTFLKSITDATDAKSERLAGTRERIGIANELYGYVNEMYDYGKDYWYTRNEAYYKDYVIYDTPSGAPELSGDTGSVSGTVLDKMSMLPVNGGMISLELVDSPFAIDPTTGKYQGANIPIESSYAFIMSPGHKLLKTDVALVANQNTIMDILMEPGA